MSEDLPLRALRAFVVKILARKTRKHNRVIQSVYEMIAPLFIVHENAGQQNRSVRPSREKRSITQETAFPFHPGGSARILPHE